MTDAAMEIKTIKISSEGGDIIVYFDQTNGTYTFMSEEKGALFSLSEATMGALVNFTNKLKKPNLISRDRAYSVDEKRQLHPSAYKRWEAAEDEQLISLWNKGLNVSTLSIKLMRNEGAIRSRLSKLGCDTRASSPPNLAGDDVFISLVVAEGYCTECGVQIDPKRLELEQNTKQCTECASEKPFERKKIEETFGTRDDYRKDRSSWRF